MVEPKKKRRKGSGRVAFLAHMEGIKKMIEAGHPMIEVFEAYEKKMTVKEQQFRKYVNRLIRSKPDGNEGKKPDTTRETPTIEPIKPQRKGGFIYDKDGGGSDLV